jgi:hypothetical protein
MPWSWSWESVQALVSKLSVRGVADDLIRMSEETPGRLLFEVIIIVLVIFLALRKSYDPGRTRLSKKVCV